MTAVPDQHNRQTEPPATPGPSRLPAQPGRIHARDDTGAAAIIICYLALIGLLAAAALYGGGALLAARSAGYGLAQSAARAGAQQIDLATYRTTGQIRLHPALATQAAKQFLAGADATGTVDKVTATTITVTATRTQPTPQLRILGQSRVTITATATATAVPVESVGFGNSEVPLTVNRSGDGQ